MLRVCFSLDSAHLNILPECKLPMALEGKVGALARQLVQLVVCPSSALHDGPADCLVASVVKQSARTTVMLILFIIQCLTQAHLCTHTSINN